MSEVSILIRTADQTRKAGVTLSLQTTGADVIQAAVDNWALPTDTDYSLVNVTQGKSLVPSAILGTGGVKSGDTLEIQPVLQAG